VATSLSGVVRRVLLVAPRRIGVKLGFVRSVGVSVLRGLTVVVRRRVMMESRAAVIARCAAAWAGAFTLALLIGASEATIVVLEHWILLTRVMANSDLAAGPFYRSKMHSGQALLGALAPPLGSPAIDALRRGDRGRRDPVACALLRLRSVGGSDMNCVVTGKQRQGGPAGTCARVLIVDDDPGMREALQLVLSADGHVCDVADNAFSALAAVDRKTFDVVISDTRMPGLTGLELLDRFKGAHPDWPLVAITGAGGAEQAVDGIKRGAFHYLVKPFEPEQIRRVVAAALPDVRRHPDGGARRSRPPAAVATLGLVGNGPAMRTVRTAIDLVARSTAPVLITGETGAGKEIVARAIHERSARGHLPFVAVNMSAIPTELLEGELFGHVRGAFTGAAQPRKGLFTGADGGTLLLDEIGDISLALQAKLLRVLQSGDVRPVGSDRTHHPDVRVIAATHRDLPLLVKQGLFREDLYFRLNVLPVNVPALRDHREDIPALAEHFLAQARQRAPQSPVRSIDPDALRILSNAPWPGNVRELANTIERAVVFGFHETIERTQVLSAGAPAPQAWPFPTHAPWTLHRLSRAYAEWALAEAGGNKKRAAKVLGINLSTLYRWLRSERRTHPHALARTGGGHTPDLDVAGAATPTAPGWHA
jgi:two-component system, NtrC family, response regulator HydG